MIVPHNTVLQGHVLDKLKELPNDCIDVVVTSTPYYGLRDYGPDCVSVWDAKTDCIHDWQPYDFSLHNGRGDAQKSAKFSDQENIPNLKLTNATCSKCGAWKGQLGLEPHPSMFIEHLAQVFHEIKRVLKPSGSLWLNLGDTYYGSGSGQKQSEKGKWTEGEFEQARKAKDHIPNKTQSNWLQPKQKMLIPARVAIALQDQGWILRNEIVWHKVNHMPESCQDRLTRSWESLFFFVKLEKYYFDLDAIRKPYPIQNIERCKRKYLSDNRAVDGNLRSESHQNWASKVVKEGMHHGSSIGNRAVYREDSPVESSPSGANPGDVWSLTTEGLKEEHFAAFPQKLVKRILQCSMPKGGLMLDPFAGAGTSLLVAHKMGYDWLGIELVPKYCAIIEKRIERHGKIRLDGFLPSVTS